MVQSAQGSRGGAELECRMLGAQSESPRRGLQQRCMQRGAGQHAALEVDVLPARLDGAEHALRVARAGAQGQGLGGGAVTQESCAALGRYAA